MFILNEFMFTFKEFMFIFKEFMFTFKEFMFTFKEFMFIFKEFIFIFKKLFSHSTKTFFNQIWSVNLHCLLDLALIWSASFNLIPHFRFHFHNHFIYFLCSLVRLIQNRYRMNLKGVAPDYGTLVPLFAWRIKRKSLGTFLLL